MALDTYTALKTSVASWLNRSDLTDQIPDFITLFEAQLNTRLAKAGLQSRVNRWSAPVEDEYETQPPDFGGPILMTINGDVVQNITPQSLESMRALRPEATGQPEYFAVIGSEFRYFPVPVETYTAELQGYQKFPVLSGSNATNWVLDNYPNLYLYGTLLNAAPFLAEDNRVGLWSSLVESGVTDLIDAERAKRGSQMTPGLRSDLPLTGPCYGRGVALG